VQQICEETKQYFKDNGYTHLYVSLDIDAITSKNLKNVNLQKEPLFSQKDAPIYGTGTPVGNGLTREDAKFILNYFWEQDTVPVVALELVEVSPLLDFQNKTAEVAFDFIKHLVKPRPPQ
jgi:arginase family enzyme